MGEVWELEIKTTRDFITEYTAFQAGLVRVLHTSEGRGYGNVETHLHRTDGQPTGRYTHARPAGYIQKGQLGDKPGALILLSIPFHNL